MGKTPNNESLGYDIKPCNSEAPALETMENTFIVITPRSTLTRNRSAWYGHIYGSNRNVKD